MDFINELLRIRSARSRWVIGLVSLIVLLYGLFGHHTALVGGGAVALFLVIRSVGEDAENRKLARAAASSAADYESASELYAVPADSNRRATMDSKPSKGSDGTVKQHQPARHSDAHSQPDTTDKLVDEFLALDRYALMLRPETSTHLASNQVSRAIRALDDCMALVPAGNVLVGQLAEQLANNGSINDIDPQILKSGMVAVEAVYLDRNAITNEQFQRFVDAGGYEQLEFWAEEALPALLDFVDQSGQAGPRFWVDGHYESGNERLPVIGISWYEALAYARWVGKRIPTDGEWTKASAWPVESAPGRIAQRRYPWGESFDVRRANVWAAGHNRPVPVDEFSGGDSVGGIHQLIGNVWEWTSSPLSNTAQPTLHVPPTMKSIRGGAFDTYFENQATCHYQSGEFPLARRPNIGFRLALSLSALEPSATNDIVETAKTDTPSTSSEAPTAAAC